MHAHRGRSGDTHAAESARRVWKPALCGATPARAHSPCGVQGQGAALFP